MYKKLSPSNSNNNKNSNSSNKHSNSTTYSSNNRLHPETAHLKVLGEAKARTRPRCRLRRSRRRCGVSLLTMSNHLHEGFHLRGMDALHHRILHWSCRNPQATPFYVCGAAAIASARRRLSESRRLQTVERGFSMREAHRVRPRRSAPKRPRST